MSTKHSSPVTEQTALLMRADTYLADNGWGSPASEIIWDMAQFIRRLPGAPAQCALNPEALAALKNYTQADDDGVMVNVSRQALDEAIAALTSTQAPAQTTQEKFEAHDPILKMYEQHAAHAQTQPDGLAAAITEYARDLRRNSSGGDDYPWDWAKATADYLDTLAARHPAQWTPRWQCGLPGPETHHRMSNWHHWSRALCVRAGHED